MASHFNGDATSAETASAPAASPATISRWLTTLLLLVGCGVGFWFAGTQVSAQGRKSTATLNVSSQLQLTPGAESKLEIRVAPGDALPPRSVIVIRGVPANLQLSGGRPFGPGVWVIPAAETISITLQMPMDARVGGVLTVALTTLDGASLAEAHITLVTTALPQETVKTAAPPVSRASPPPVSRDDTPTAATQTLDQAPAPKLTPDIRAELLMLLEKGKDSFRLGNIQHARQFYLRAAEKGLAEAAMALAETYDPAELSRMKGVVGVLPDQALARKWYEEAKQLGSPEAAARISGLGRP